MTTNTHMIALDPAQLANAQHGLIGFCMEKIGQVRGELAEAQRIFDELVKANMSVIAAQRMIRAAKRRIAFYEKVQAASGA